MGPILLPKTGGLFRYAKDNEKDLVTEVEVQPRLMMLEGRKGDKGKGS